MASAKKVSSAKKTAGARAPRIASSHKGVVAKTPKRAAAKPRIPLSRAAAAPAPAPAVPKLRKPRAAELPVEAASLASDESRAIATLVAIAALDKKAVGLELLDVAGKIDYADFIVLMTGRSDRHVQALAQGIEDELRKKGKRALSIEGIPAARWVLMDLGDVVVHVFQEEARSLYDIDGLWMDAARLPLPASAEPGRD